MASRAAQNRAISLYQNALGRVSRRIGQQTAARLQRAASSPAYDEESLRALVRRGVLNGLADQDSARPLPGIVNSLLVVTMQPLLPEATTAVTFSEPREIAFKQLEKAITRALAAKKRTEREEIIAGAAVDLQAARVEATRAAIVAGTAPCWAAGERLQANQRSKQPEQYHWQRVLEPGACSWCSSIVPQKTAISHDFSRHEHDRCTRRLVRGAL